MSQEYPKVAQGIVQEEKGKSLKYGELPLPEKLEDGDLIIQVLFAPINPSDQLFIAGKYPGGKPYPCFVGGEGSGKVVAGEGKGKEFIGKRVGFLAKQGTTSGSYSNYVVSTVKQVQVLSDDVNDEIGACSYVNPFTAVAMHKTTLKHDSKAIIHDVGASALGKQMNLYFQEKGVDIINIVRRKEQEDELKEKFNCKYVLNQNDENFSQKLNELATKLEAKIAFDAIGGEFLGTLYNAVPKNTTIYVYGLLAEDSVGQIDAKSLLFEGKTVTGWILPEKMKSFSQEEIQDLGSETQKYFNKCFATKINKKYPQKEFQEGLDFYSKNMTAGKVLFYPSQ